MANKGTNKGNYYKIKSKEWLKDKGYEVEYIEKLQRIFTKGKVVYIKKDLFGADLAAISDSEFILVNSILTKHNIAAHIKEFKKYPQGGSIKRWLLVWTPKVREPEIVEVT